SSQASDGTGQQRLLAETRTDLPLRVRSNCPEHDHVTRAWCVDLVAVAAGDLHQRGRREARPTMVTPDTDDGCRTKAPVGWPRLRCGQYELRGKPVETKLVVAIELAASDQHLSLDVRADGPEDLRATPVAAGPRHSVLQHACRGEAHGSYWAITDHVPHVTTRPRHALRHRTRLPTGHRWEPHSTF